MHSNNDILGQAGIKNNMDEVYRPNLPKIHHNAEETKREEQELNGLNPQTDTDEIDEQISNGTNIEALEELPTTS